MPNYAALTDEQLILAYYDCDDDAFDALYHRHHAKLRRFIIGKLRPDDRGLDELAEDLAQETRIEVVVSKGRPSRRWRRDGGASFRTWLYRIAARKVVAHYRGQGSVLDNAMLESEAHLADESRDDQDGPVARASVEDLQPLDPDFAAALDACIQELTPLEQHLLHLRYYEGFTQREVAEILDWSEERVSLTLKRIRKKLAECLRLKGYGPDAQSESGAHDE